MITNDTFIAHILDGMTTNDTFIAHILDGDGMTTHDTFTAHTDETAITSFLNYVTLSCLYISCST